MFIFGTFCQCYVSLSSVTILHELITSATTFGALLGGLVAGAMSDWTGRRLVLGIADVIFISGAIGQAVCRAVWDMVSFPSSHVEWDPSLRPM